MHPLRPFIAALAVLLVTAAPSPGAQNATIRTLANEPGTWHPWTCSGLSASDVKLLGFTLADADATKMRLRQIADIFRKSPVWNPPMGVDPSLSGALFGPSTYAPYAKMLKGQPIAGSIMMGSFEHYEVIRTIGGKEQRKGHIGDETVHLLFHVNLLPAGAGVNMLSDSEGAFYEEPVRTGDIGGFPTYGDMLVITKNGRPLWTPVSRERYLKAFIAKRRPEAVDAESYIAIQQKNLDAFIAPDAAAARQAKYKAAIDKMAPKGASAVEHERRYWERDEADQLAVLKRGASRDPKVSPLAGVVSSVKVSEERLAAMSPAERSAPACILEDRNDPSRSGLVAMGTPKCVPLVGKNPAFFDPQLPRSVPQIIVVSRIRALEKEWKKGRPGGDKKGSLDLWTTYEAFRQADLQKVADQIGR